MESINLKKEEEYHNKVAELFDNARKYDFIWEIPEEFFLLKLKYFKNKSVIDVGCGPAVSIANILNKDKKFLFNCNYIGVDISQKMLDLAKKNIPKGIFIKCDIGNLNSIKKPVDTFLSLGALHHTENHIKTIKNWMKFLKPKGYLLMREPLYEALKRGEGASPIEEGIKNEEILKVLKENNFIIVKNIFFTSQFFHFMNRILIKILGDFWKKTKILWYPLMILDILLVNVLGKFASPFKGEACIIIAQKV